MMSFLLDMAYYIIATLVGIVLLYVVARVIALAVIRTLRENQERGDRK